MVDGELRRARRWLIKPSEPCAPITLVDLLRGEVAIYLGN